MGTTPQEDSEDKSVPQGESLAKKILTVKYEEDGERKVNIDVLNGNQRVILDLLASCHPLSSRPCYKYHVAHYEIKTKTKSRKTMFESLLTTTLFLESIIFNTHTHTRARARAHARTHARTRTHSHTHVCMHVCALARLRK